MSDSFRRYEILLPLRSNDGQQLPETLFVDVVLELEKHFGAVSSETQVIRDRWHHEGTTIPDELVRLFVDVLDTLENRAFFVSYKERLKVSFGQLDIWITSHPLDVL